MCLGTPLKDQKRAIKRMTNKQGYIRAWKKVYVGDKSFAPTYISGKHKNGLCKAQRKRKGMMVNSKSWGFHAFRNRKSAENFNSSGGVIECLALPEWVRFVGAYHGHILKRKIDDDIPLKTVTFTHLFFPTFPDRKPKVKDFWKAVKEAKP